MANEEGELNIHKLLRDSFNAAGITVSKDAELGDQAVAALRLRHMVNLCSDAIIIADIADDRLIDFNETTPRLLGYSADELYCLPLETVFGEKFFREMRALQQSGQMHRIFESTIKKRDCIEIPAEISLHISGFAGRKYLYANIRNISERIDALAEKATVDEQMHRAAKMDAVASLAGGVAHDFNNQLTVIRGYCDLLIGILKDNSDARPLTEQIICAAERASALTTKLLSVGRMQILHQSVFNVNSVLAMITKPFIETLDPSIDFRMSLDPHVGNINTDQSLFEGVIMCLISNAREATPKGGQILIRTANVDLGVDYVNKNVESTPGPHVMISVCDNGAGMDQQVLEKIFDPFFTTKPKGQGLGLGLTLVYGFARQADGHIRVQSEPGKGTTFELYLPRTTSAEDIPSCVNPNQSHRETILVVDDDAPVRQLLSTILKGQGYDLLESGAAEDAIKLAQDHKQTIDMLITDVEMPGTSGPKLAQSLCKTNPHMKVLYISGHPIDTVVRHGGGHVDMHQLQKPFRPSTLVQTVRTLLDGQNQDPP